MDRQTLGQDLRQQRAAAKQTRRPKDFKCLIKVKAAMQEADQGITRCDRGHLKGLKKKIILFIYFLPFWVFIAVWVFL